MNPETTIPAKEYPDDVNNRSEFSPTKKENQKTFTFGGSSTKFASLPVTSLKDDDDGPCKPAYKGKVKKSVQWQKDETLE